MKTLMMAFLLMMLCLAASLLAQDLPPQPGKMIRPSRPAFVGFEGDSLHGMLENTYIGAKDYLPQSNYSGKASNIVGSVQEAWVRQFASGLAPGQDVATDVAVDNAGNVYVTGYSTSLPFGTDYLTVKYTATGAKAWEARYNGPGKVDDRAVAIAIDGSGNAYVTGESWGGDTDYDYATIKYNSEGAEQWVARYNGPENFNDEATDLAIDSAGNIYVNGRNWKRSASYDYATIKYSSAGVQQWIARYIGPNIFSNEGTKMAVDASGNVYITGLSTGIGIDYVTIKYSSAGVRQWIAQYNGTGNSTDAATALTIDASGNVYVTGWSTGMGTNADFATIKYNSSGVQQWVARYNGPQNGFDLPLALAVDTAGNVYVSGIFDVVVKYNSAGVQEWVAQTGNSGGLAPDLAVDPAGNIYVTGSINGDYATIKYNGAGAPQWAARYNGPGNSSDNATALAIDAAGNVYVTGLSDGSGTGADYATVKYNSDGVQQWAARYHGPGNSNEQANAVAVDATGNVYVTGSSQGAGTDDDYATIKYNPAGEQQWAARYNGPGNFWDRAYAIGVDASGNVYVTGESWGPRGTGTEYATIKYNSAGVQQWVARYDGPGFDVAVALAVDAAGNVYVTGRSFGTGNDDYATIKYNSAGAQQWVARYNGLANSSDLGIALAVDTAGNVYVTGLSIGAGTGDDYATIKYNAAGVEQWVARYNGPTSLSDYAIAVAVDATGNIYVTGQSNGTGTSTDYATIKYNAAGVEQWVARYNGPANSTDEAADLVIDVVGNIYVTGRSVGLGTNADYGTVKYNSAGVQQWVARYNGPGNFIDRATDLVVDAAGNVYVTGWGWGLGRSYDFATIKYNSAGAEQWSAGYNGPESSTDLVPALALDTAGNVYVTGSSRGLGWSIYTTIKYITPLPAMPTLAAPANGAVNQPTTLTLSWNAAADAETYRLQVATHSDFATPLVDDSTLTTTLRQVGLLAYNTTYYWRVRARNIGGASAYSPTWRFTTIQLPSQVLLVSPTPAAVLPSGNVKFTWRKSQPAINRYWLEVAADSAMANSVIDTTLKAADTTKVVLQLLDKKTYWWRVRAGNVAGWGPFSEQRRFSIDVPVNVEGSENNPIPTEFNLSQNHPNPFNPSTTIKYDLPKQVEVKLEIFDMTGRRVRTLVNQRQQARGYAITWDGRNEQGEALASGLYLYQLRAGTFVQTRRMALVR